ncbi:hypothetical protein KSS87_007803 [Heliosperma pusillum]|nr:hypothetical protein KSS87_007803 [Heliosperma pusillum]
MASPMSLRSYKSMGPESQTQSSGGSMKNLNIQYVVQLTEVGEGLMAKMYRLNQILDHPDSINHVYSEAFWKAGVVPNFPKICTLVARRFPEHTGKLNLERVDKLAFDTLMDGAEGFLQNLEPWVQLLLDLMAFREQAVRLLLDISSTVITLLPHQNSFILHAFMDLFCSFVRVNLFAEKIPGKMMLQLYNLLHGILRNDRDCDFYHRPIHPYNGCDSLGYDDVSLLATVLPDVPVTNESIWPMEEGSNTKVQALLIALKNCRLVQFIDSYDPPVKGLQEDLNFVSPRIGEVLEAVGPVIFLSADTRKLRNEGFLSPYHPRYPDILTNSAHPMRAQDLASVTSYREWVLLGYLVCPDELLRVTSIDIALVVLKENLVLTLFRDEYILLHEEYQRYVLPRILESKKIAKAGRTKQKEADLDYSVAKQVEKMISEVHEQAFLCCDAIHHERRILLKQEIGRMVLFFTDQPSLLAPNIQMVFSALALAQSEVIWYFQHIGIMSSKSRVSNHVLPVEIDPTDPTIGFLLDGMDHLCCLVRKYIPAVRCYALSYLSSCAGRIRFLLGTPGMVALDLDASLKGNLQKIVQHLEKIPKPQGENISAITCDLTDFRKDWLSVLMTVTSSRSSINIRHLEKATVSTGKEGLLVEGNAAYNWSRCVDEIELQLVKHGSLKKLYFYHQHLTSPPARVPAMIRSSGLIRVRGGKAYNWVFSKWKLNTMFGPEGRPQHCCAWLGVASSFPECASHIVPEEVTKVGRDAVLYVESLIESIMGGLEGLINILDSEGGFGSLEMQLLPEQAAIYLNTSSRHSNLSSKSPRGLPGMPGQESYPENNSSVKMLEAAMQRLTNLCSVLNDMEPICVLNHVFVLREYMRECILGNFRRRLLSVLKTDNDLQRPSVLESLVRRQMSIIHLAEQHVSMDLTQGIREVLLAEVFAGPISSLHLFEKPANLNTGLATETICNWYLDHIVKDVSGAGVLYVPAHNCFRSTRPTGGYFAESVTDMKELQAFVHLFGSYGVDRLERMIKEHIAALLNCIGTSLRSNRDALEAMAGTLNSGDRIEADAYIKQIVDLDTVVEFCIQAGHALAFYRLISEAAGDVLKEDAPLIYSLLEGIVQHLPKEVPEKKDISRMKEVANGVGVGVANDHDSQFVRSIMEDVGVANDASWNWLPYLLSAFMSSSIWSTTAFNVDTGGFNNNIHCLARCINAVIAGNEYVRMEKENQVANGHVDETLESQMQNSLTAEASTKATLLLFVKMSTGLILDCWHETNRSDLAPQLIFMDQLCEISPYLPRSALEDCIPYSIIRSLYSQYYGSSPAIPLALRNMSPRSSPGVSLMHGSPALRQVRGEMAQSSGPGRDNSYDAESGSAQLNDKRYRNLRGSGPLEYTSSRKVKFSEGSASGSTGPSPLPRFAVSRSGPISYK